jgi:ABC-type Fe3+ transport system substrate-binding protein
VPPAPRINKVLFLFYLLLTVGLLIAALVAPQVRSLAYAPLRDLIVPPPEPIVVSVLYSTEKAEWMATAVERFQDTNPHVAGHPIELELKKTGSREMYLAVLDGTEQPVLISPASSLQISLLEDLSAVKFGRPVVDPGNPETCRPVLETPLVLVAWKERAAVLWGDDPNSHLWLRLHDAVTGDTWDTYGHPEWGYIKFGQTDPLRSNSGFQTLLLMTYNYFDKTRGLTSKDLLDPGYQAWYTDFGRNVAKFGDSTGTFMQEIVAYGPSLYDLVAVYESTAIEQAENAVGRYGELQVYYPPATHLSDHPFCVLQAEWVTPQQASAAKIFVDFLTGHEMQELALMQHGFRPVDRSIPLDQAGSPFQRYAVSGLRVDLPPEVETPPGSVLNTLLDFWTRNVGR